MGKIKEGGRSSRILYWNIKPLDGYERPSPYGGLQWVMVANGGGAHVSGNGRSGGFPMPTICSDYIQLIRYNPSSRSGKGL